MRKLFLLFCWGLLAQAHAAEFQYFVFPMQDIIGVPNIGQSSYGSLINKQALDELLFPLPSSSDQKRIGRDEFHQYFQKKLQETYSGATVHPTQIGNGRSFNQYQFAANRGCSSDTSLFRTPIADSYAVSLGLTRLSLFRNDFDKYVQVFVPVTFTVQFIRPHGLQIVFSKSQTEYVGREFTKQEALDASGKFNNQTIQILRDLVTKAAMRSVDKLMLSAKTGFSPKQAPVGVVDWKGDYVILDKGPDAGFSSSQTYTVYLPNDENEYYFQVLRTQSGWTVGKFEDGMPKISKGMKLNVAFTSVGKDDSKPDLMPLINSNVKDVGVISDEEFRNSLVEYFSSNVGFGAPFNLSTLSPILENIGSDIKRDANCVDPKVYETIPGLSRVSTVNRQTPAFFLAFDMAKSQAFRTELTGGTKSRDVFRMVENIRISDRENNVVHSTLAEFKAENEIAYGKGLNLREVEELALKNVSTLAAQSLISNLKINPREFTVQVVEPGRIKLSKAAGTNFEAGSILLRPLGVNVNGSPVYLPFSEMDVALSSDTPTVEGSDLWVKVNDPKKTLRPGDVLRSVQFIDKKDKISSCAKPVFEIPNNAIKINNTAVANLIATHALVTSGRFNVVEPDFLSIQATNKKLEALFYKEFISDKASTVGFCYTPAIWIKDENSQCTAPNNCSISGSIGSGILIDKDQKFWKRDLIVSKFSANEIEQNSKARFFELKAFEAFAATAAELSKKLAGF